MLAGWLTSTAQTFSWYVVLGARKNTLCSVVKYDVNKLNIVLNINYSYKITLKEMP
jgi:hypothetical protein